MVTLTLAGTGGMMPLPNRYLTCLAIEYMGNSILIDCGEATQVALKSSKIKLSKINTLLITHFHADHIAGLPGLLLTLGNAGKLSPLTIIGARGIEKIVKSLIVIAPALPFEIEIIEIEDSNFTFQTDGMDISCIKLKHAITCYGYRIDIRRKPVFNPLKASELNVPLELYRVLHGGQNVTLSDGRIITTQMVTDSQRETMSLAYCTDTIPFDEISEFINNVDYYFAEGMYIDESMKEKMIQKGHSTFLDSAKLAKMGNVKNLVITHFSPALTDPLEEDIAHITDVFENTIVGYDGIVFEI